MNVWLYPFLIALLVFAPLSHANEPDALLEITISADTSISIARFGNSGQRVLWLPSEQGLDSSKAYPLAQRMAAQGMEIWLADLHGSYFISPGRTSLDDIPTAAIADLIQQSLPDAPQQLFLLTSGLRRVWKKSPHWGGCNNVLHPMTSAWSVSILVKRQRMWKLF